MSISYVTVIPPEKSGPAVMTQKENLPLASKVAFAVTFIVQVAVKPFFNADLFLVRQSSIPTGTAGRLPTQVAVFPWLTFSLPSSVFPSTLVKSYPALSFGP